MPHFTDARLLEIADQAEVPVPRGDPRRRLAEVVDALAARASLEEVQDALAAAAEALWDDAARDRVEDVLEARHAGIADLDPAGADGPLALAVAYRAALPLLARDERVQTPLRELETSFAGLDEDDRSRFGPVLARAAVPVIGLDLASMKDEGYYFVSVYPPEGSEGVDIVGKAAIWLTKRMTMDDDAPRTAMRRFLALLAEEVEVELPLVSATLDAQLAEPVPAAPHLDPLFVALARGLVEEAVEERGFPF